MFRTALRILSALALWFAAGSAALAQCPASVPAQGAALPGPLPLFPATNWWNLDVSSAPVDPASASYISFVNNGGTRWLHPDFGGEFSPGSVDIYGMPYAVVDATQPKQAVTFQYWDESDGVDYATGQGIPFYPIPAQAITQSHWVEGGAPANVDQRDSGDRHLLMIDCSNKYLYELYNVYFNSTQGQWYAGSGAFFDMNTNNRRPDTWTSADAAGLAIFPGLVRYDEAWNPAVTDIGHALRVTVRTTNGYVYPASHAAGSTAGALPMGARLRLKTNVGGADPALRTSDPNARKIFRAMQKYGLIVADNGSDLYVTGTFDTRWNNDVLNPAFSTLTASDFEVIQLGWNPPSGGSNADLSSLTISAGTLTPPFASGTLSYTDSVSNATTSVTITPTVADASSTIGVNGTTVASGSASGPIALAVGSGNVINVVVTAQDGTTTKTYTITVTREQALVRIAETFAIYTSIQSAYAAATAGQTIQMQDGEYAEDLVFGNPISVMLMGGYDATFTTNSGSTVLSGSLTIGDGTVIADNVVIE